METLNPAFGGTCANRKGALSTYFSPPGWRCNATDYPKRRGKAGHDAGRSTTGRSAWETLFCFRAKEWELKKLPPPGCLRTVLAPPGHCEIVYNLKMARGGIYLRLEVPCWLEPVEQTSRCGAIDAGRDPEPDV